MPDIVQAKVSKARKKAPTRVTQACDRCRHKKIRCDNSRPSCIECIDVGVEYTWSYKSSCRSSPQLLGERVRNLEAEVKQLNGLLDENDKKFGILSRIQSLLCSSRRPSDTVSPSAITNPNLVEATASYPPVDQQLVSSHPPAAPQPRADPSSSNGRSSSQQFLSSSLFDPISGYVASESNGIIAGTNQIQPYDPSNRDLMNDPSLESDYISPAHRENPGEINFEERVG